MIFDFGYPFEFGIDNRAKKNNNYSSASITVDGKTYKGNTIYDCYRQYEEDVINLRRKKNDGIVFTDSEGNKFSIKEVKFSNPATIVFWSDNTKTVVKAHSGDKFDKEKGLAMAIIKKIAGNNHSYYERIFSVCDENAN